MPLIALKLAVVPGFLLLISLAGNRWGPRVSGWLAGFPVVAGPILCFVAIENGAEFASQSAISTLAGVSATVAFGVAYARAAQRLPWWFALLIALPAWGAIALVLSFSPSGRYFAIGVCLLALVTAPRLFPATQATQATLTGHRASSIEMLFRMLAGALLTVAVTAGASDLGPRWSGLLAAFPVLTLILATFCHGSQGPAFVSTLLRAMVSGLYSFSAFCLVLSLALPHLGVAGAFVVSTISALIVQAVTSRFLRAR